MATRKLELIYENGETQIVTVKHSALAAAEEKAVSEHWNLNGFRQGLYAAYWQLRHNQQISEPFETWCDRIVESRSVESDDPLDGRKVDTAN